MNVYGRVIHIRKTKDYVFLTVLSKDKEQIQIVVDKTKFENIKENDIIGVDGLKDNYNNIGNSLIANSIKRIALNNKSDFNEFNENALIVKSKITHKVRNFLNDKEFIEVDLPILSFSESSSASHSFSAKYEISDDTVYLRKNLDTMLRIVTASNIDKIYSIGHCFRNEHITSKREPEFEMLSIYANYYSQEDMIEFTKKLICSIFKEKIQFQDISYKDYALLNKEELNGNLMYVVKGYPIDKKSNAQIDVERNCMKEFKIISRSGTVVHGITEITRQEEYEKLCQRQNMGILNGENMQLYSSFKGGTAPCSSIGISLNRLIFDLCPEIKKMKDLQMFPFSRVKKYKGNINIKENANYNLLIKYFTNKEIKSIYFKEPYIFRVDIETLTNVLKMIENSRKYDFANIKLQILQHPSKLRELINTYELLSSNLKTQGDKDEKERN